VGMARWGKWRLLDTGALFNPDNIYVRDFHL
jgi:hypothetical protein